MHVTKPTSWNVVSKLTTKVQISFLAFEEDAQSSHHKYHKSVYLKQNSAEMKISIWLFSL